MVDHPDELLELVGLVYEGVLETVPWTMLLEQLRLRLQANYVSLAIRSPSQGDPGRMVFAGPVRPAICLSYERSLYALDPFVDLPFDRVLMLHEVVDEPQWLCSALYRDVLKDLQIRHVMGADLVAVPGCPSRLRISRAPGAAPFGEHERALCTFLLAHIKRALRLHARLEEVESERRLYAATLGHLGIGILRLDAQGNQLLCSAIAERLLAADHGLRLQGGRLQACSGLDDRRLWRAIRKILAARASTGVGLVEAMSLGRPGQGLGVLLRGLAPPEGCEVGPPAALEVILRDPQCQPEPSDVLLRQLFQLTPAEAALAVQLCHGQTLEQAAMDLGISRNTARAHLRVIFSKTGATRQATLVQLLLGSVAALSPARA